jgi:hypothetical protein
VEKRRKANPEYERLNAWNVQCAKEISGVVSTAEFGNPMASMLAKRILGVMDGNGRRIRADYGWTDCCPSYRAYVLADMERRIAEARKRRRPRMPKNGGAGRDDGINQMELDFF